MPGSVTLIRSAELAHTEYAYAATAPADSRLVFLAGSCSIDADGCTVAIGDYRGQAAKCMRNAFGDHDAPSTLVGVTVLGYDHQLVEIEAVAAVR
jgi:hypothetical protein